MKSAAHRPLPSIRAHIYTLVWACALPAIVGFALLANNFYERERDQIQLESLITARALIQAVDRDLNTGITMALALANSPSLDNNDLAAFHALASKALRPEFPGFNFVLSDRDSVQLLNTVRPFGAPMPDPGSLERIRKVFDTGRAVISDVFIGGALKRPLVAVHVPVLRNGKVIYCLSVGFVPERLGMVLREQRLPTDRVAGIFDSQGVIVARTREPEKYVGKRGSPSLLARMGSSGEAAIETDTLEGTAVYSMYSHSRISGWAVVIGVPRSTVLAEMVASIRWITLIVAGLLVFGVASAWYFARRMGHSVQALSYAASALGKDTDLRLDRVRPVFREADDAIHTLQAVESELQRYRHRLESAIEERTLQLQSAQREASDRELRTRTVMDNVGDGIIAINAEGVIESFNRAACGIFGYTPEEAIGSNIMRLMPESMRGAHHAGMARYLAGGAPTVVGKNNVELQGLRKDGSTFVLELSIRALFVEGHHLFVGIVRDVTERKRGERELRQAMEQAQIASAAKDVFVANMSHELRTPMNAVLGMAHLLNTTGLSPEQGRYLEMIRASGQSLLGILNDILDFSKMNAGKIEMHPVRFQLDDVLHSLASIMSISVGEKNLELCLGVELDVPRALVGDALRLQQILVNLTGNAIKFTEQGEVSVLVERAAGEGAVLLRFTVRDTGIGMSEEQLARLFSPFTQGDLSTTRRFGGTGLGLTISKGLIELLGGAIEVSSTVGLGSAFSFTLPMKLGDGAGAPKPAHRRHLLVVDDNPTSRSYLGKTIQAWGWTCDIVATGAEALALLRSGRAYDAALVDWQMPDMDGPATMRAVQQESGTPVICMVNAYGRSKLVQDMEAVAAPVFLTKPVTASSLYDAVQTALAHRHGEAAAGPAAPGPKVLSGVRVLLVEDNPINQQVAKGILEQAGAVVAVGENGEEALKLLRDGLQCDLVLMDVQMPVMDGFTATRAIRGELRMTLPVIAMTAGVMESEREQCIAAGMDDFIGKPVDVDQMFATIAKHLRWVAA
ncbi:response regulator [Duganella sp. HH101]|uniref:response regulator n=1 Tax=Duganella sp. HH101 TaxID=1781066 RepID=UPI0008746DF2|nr:response regulator [Duganella sp. HH101]OFA03694.1 signal transduction histidine-protein kinase BarA [Duganella sp. HH101]